MTILEPDTTIEYSGQDVPSRFKAGEPGEGGGTMTRHRTMPVLV